MAYTIDLVPVTSSNLSAVGYDPRRLILAVQFKDAHIWHYAGVPLLVFVELMAAPSIGSFYTQQIRGKFAGQKMTGECPKCGDTGYIGERCADCGCDTYVGPVLHALMWDHPEAQHPRRKPTDCGSHVKPSEIAPNADAVTCGDCRQVAAERDAIQVE
jgi:hypothetical protein